MCRLTCAEAVRSDAVMPKGEAASRLQGSCRDQCSALWFRSANAIVARQRKALEISLNLI
jgi:hypothetical protein